MKSYVELVTVPTRDNNSTLVLLHFDERRYMFGRVSEGTQRMLGENQVKMTRIGEIFLSGKTEWENNGGLTGLLLTMGDIKATRELDKLQTPRDPSKFMVTHPDGTVANRYPPPSEPKGLTVHGGKNILSTIATTRNFIFRENSGVHFHEYNFVDGNVIFKDEFITVTPLRVFPRRGEGPAPTKEEARLRNIEDVDLGSREQLERIVESMWNGKPGQLQVGKDDEDYVISLTSRLKYDEERARHERAGSAAGSKSGSNAEDEGESPPKRIKLDSEQTGGNEEAAWDEIVNPPAPTKPVPEFPASRPLRRPWPATSTRSLPGTMPSTSSLSYMVSIVQVRGRFRPDIAKSLGVLPGPSFRILTDGGSVTLDNGTVVHGHQCMDPPRPVNGVAYLDVPDESYLEPTIEGIDAWKEDKRQNKENSVISLWVWALGPNLEKNERLLSYIETMDGQHMLNSRTSPFEDISFKDSSAQATRLNLLDPEHFPLASPDYAHPSITREPEPSDKDKIVRAQDALIVDIHPTQGIQTVKLRPRFDYQIVQKDAKTGFGNGKYWRAVQAVQKQVNEEEPRRDSTPSPSDEVEIVTLGTGSSMPSKYRNVSATAVTAPGFGNLLLDCGESTLNQLRRSYGVEKTKQFLRDMKILYISHLHADHHLGTVAVLKAWFLETAEGSGELPKLYLVAPHKFLNFLEEYTQVEDFGLRRIKFISCDSLLIASQQQADMRQKEDWLRIEDMVSSLALEKVETSRAVHCRGSFTVAFTFKQPEGFKLAYSGDTRPTNGFVEIGKDCTVLLHEATFDDELKDEALAKRHCTTSEAIQAGNDMGAKNLLLTHFSQRYPKLPNIRQQSSNGENPLCDPFMDAPEDKESTYIGRPKRLTVDEKWHDGPVISKPTDESVMNIGFAFDMMRVKVKDFWKLEKFIPALKQLFMEEEKLDTALETETPIKPSKGQAQQQKKKQGHGPLKNGGKPHEKKGGKNKQNSTRNGS